MTLLCALSREVFQDDRSTCEFLKLGLPTLLLPMLLPLLIGPAFLLLHLALGPAPQPVSPSAPKTLAEAHAPP